MFTSDRTFELVSYDSTRGALLFRSKRTASDFASAVEIYITDVRAMELRCLFDGVTIEEINIDALNQCATKPAVLFETGNRAYRFRGVGWTGFVVGGILRTRTLLGMEWSELTS